MRSGCGCGDVGLTVAYGCTVADLKSGGGGGNLVCAVVQSLCDMRSVICDCELCGLTVALVAGLGAAVLLLLDPHAVIAGGLLHRDALPRPGVWQRGEVKLLGLCAHHQRLLLGDLGRSTFVLREAEG